MSAARLDQGFAELRTDLVHAEGPRISTMRNYRFAILQYEPRLEYRLRRNTQQLTQTLIASGWVVLPIDLQQVFFDRLRGQGEQWLDRVARMEGATTARDDARGLQYLKGKIGPLIEGPEGIAADCARLIDAHVAAHPDQADRTLVIVSGTAALYPFLRSSALLKHLDGRTHNVAVVLLYPGERRGRTGLSFMGVLPPDNDYRPRIYPS